MPNLSVTIERTEGESAVVVVFSFSNDLDEKLMHKRLWNYFGDDMLTAIASSDEKNTTVRITTEKRELAETLRTNMFRVFRDLSELNQINLN